MMRWIPFALAACVLLFGPSDSRALEPDPRPIVRAEIRPERAVVGSPIHLSITVLVPTWFTHAPDYPDLELAGLVVRLPPDSSSNVQETLSGTVYSGIVREYVLRPQREADYVLDGRRLGVHYADPETRRSVDVELPLPAIRFRGIIPPPAADLDPFVATDRLSLEQTIEGGSGTLRVGDAVTRTLRIRARNLPALFLPPLLEDQPGIPGLRAYPRNPVTTDIPGRRPGHPTGSRLEAVTYVIEEPGEYTLPAVSLRWWNRRTGSIETATVEPLDFSVVAGQTGLELDPPPGRAERSMRNPGLLFVGFFALLVIGWTIRERIRRFAARSWAWFTRRTTSEPVRFRRLLRAVGRDDARAIQEGLDAWLGSIGLRPPTLSSLGREGDFELLIRSMQPVERRLYLETTDPTDVPRIDATTLRRALRQARRKLLGASRRPVSRHSLPPLNPR
ncbi:MAG TPA: hypothetical protein ENI85_02035 [Deltaproteobacteria bacterium]|nr:hypothetical protein [Deltaproteobacteria bacterium]